jgi:hypothetical protein
MRIFVIAAGWIGAMALHGIWNGFASYVGIGGLAIAYLLLMVVLFVMIWIVFRDRKRIVGLIQSYLPAYQPTGLVAQYDVNMLSSLPGRRHARQWAKTHGGRGGLRAMNDYQLAATELGLLHERARRRVIDEPTFDEEQQALLECMAGARAQFPPPPPAPPGGASSGYRPGQGGPPNLPDAAYRRPFPGYGAHPD